MRLQDMEGIVRASAQLEDLVEDVQAYTQEENRMLRRPQGAIHFGQTQGNQVFDFTLLFHMRLTLCGRPYTLDAIIHITLLKQKVQ